MFGQYFLSSIFLNTRSGQDFLMTMFSRIFCLQSYLKNFCGHNSLSLKSVPRVEPRSGKHTSNLRHNYLVLPGTPSNKKVFLLYYYIYILLAKGRNRSRSYDKPKVGAGVRIGKRSVPEPELSSPSLNWSRPK